MKALGTLSRLTQSRFGVRLNRLGLAVQIAAIEYDDEEINEKCSFDALDTLHRELGKIIRDMKKHEGA